MTKNTIHQMELLAPAGSYETFCAVINAGADAVYAAGDRFGARAYAANFTTEELVKALNWCNALGKRFYLTVNTLFKENELNELTDYIAPFYERGLSGVIVQDLGVAAILKAAFPGLEIHASTQMAVYSIAGAKELYDSGFSQMVVPRELTVDEIRAIHESCDIRLECFVHGALCYSISGQCLFSSILGGRSGNRGRCAQPCRLPYEVYNEKGHLLKKGYPLSPKDLCALDYLNDLYNSGVYSLKIEGRMKKPEYAAGVTAIYRKYLDEVLRMNGQAIAPSDKVHSKLLSLGNRSGFTSGYLTGSVNDMIAIDNPSHEKDSVSTTYDTELPLQPVDIYAYIHADEQMIVTYTYNEYSYTATGNCPSLASNRPADATSVSEKLSKLGNTPFKADNIIIDMDDGLFVPVKELNNIRRECIQGLFDELRAYHPDRQTLSRESCKTTPSDKPYLQVQVCSKEQLDTAISDNDAYEIILDCHYFKPDSKLAGFVNDIHSADKKAVYALPVNFRNSVLNDYISYANALREAGFDSFLVRAFDEICFIRDYIGQVNIIAGENIYTWNSSAMEYFRNAGVTQFTAPQEFNFKELINRNNADSAIIIYEHTPLMTSYQCILKNTDKCRMSLLGNSLTLKDRYSKNFKVKTLCDICSNRIYNSLPTILMSEAHNIKRLGAEAYRIILLDEDRQKTSDILNMYKQAFIKDEKVRPAGEFTYGHFKRGVE